MLSVKERCCRLFIAEAVFTFVFVLVVLGATDEKKGAGAFAGLAIGLTPCRSSGCSSWHRSSELLFLPEFGGC